MKQKWLDYLVQHPYVVTQKEVPVQKDCVTSKTLTQLFGLMFVLVQKVMESFGVKVTTGQLGFDETVLDVFLVVFKEFRFVSVRMVFIGAFFLVFLGCYVWVLMGIFLCLFL